MRPGKCIVYLWKSSLDFTREGKFELRKAESEVVTMSLRYPAKKLIGELMEVCLVFMKDAILATWKGLKSAQLKYPTIDVLVREYAEGKVQIFWRYKHGYTSSMSMCLLRMLYVVRRLDIDTTATCIECSETKKRKDFIGVKLCEHFSFPYDYILDKPYDSREHSRFPHPIVPD